MPDNLPAGAELNKRIATLFGWTGITFCQYPNIEGADGWYGVPPDGLEQKVPGYSTDGNAMLKLIEAMRERGWYPRQVGLNPFHNCGWCCRFFRSVEPMEKESRAHGDTLPHAVSLAALAALEGENAR